MALEVVLDASVFLAFLLDEDLGKHAERILADGPVVVIPAICDFEVAYVLTKKARRGEISRVDAFNLYQAYELIRGSRMPMEGYSSEMLHEAFEKQLSPFDQAYLGLSKELGFPLVSADLRHIEQGAQPLEQF